MNIYRITMLFAALAVLPAVAEGEWREVCQPRCGDYACKVEGVDLLSLDSEDIQLEPGAELLDYYGKPRFATARRVKVHGKTVDYAFTEVSNCVYVVWSNSPLFDSE